MSNKKLQPGQKGLETYSCNECKRRRIKCSRELPSCKSCFRSKRHCLYESQLKSRLTRRHLTAVEEQLRIMRQLFVKYFPNADVDDILKHSKNGLNVNDIPNLEDLIGASEVANSTESSTLRRLKETPATYSHTKDIHTKDIPGTSPINRMKPNEEYDTFYGGKMHFQQIHEFQIQQFVSPTVRSYLRMTDNEDRTNNGFPSDIESEYRWWDERRQIRSDSNPSIVEGMAISNSHGYLGATSSAALLNLVGGGYFMHERGEAELTGQEQKISLMKQDVNNEMLELNVSKYFEVFHVSYPIIYKPHFQAYLNEVLEPPPGWKSLLYIVAAIGSYLAATSPDEADDLMFYELAKRNLSLDLFETGNLILVQILTLMSNYMQKRDLLNTGYVYLGLALRIALGLGIHKNNCSSSETLLEKEMRRRVWWCLYIFDSGQMITAGRLMGVSSSGIDVDLPRNIHELQLTNLTKVMPAELDVPTVFTTFRLQSLFHLLTSTIYERLISTPFPEAHQLLQWDAMYIQRWKSLIPSYFAENSIVQEKFRLPQAVLHWRCRNLRIIMFRTFALKSSAELVGDILQQRAKSECLDECHHTIKHMEKLWRDFPNGNRMSSWYSLYFLIPAVVMPLVCIRNDTMSEMASMWREDIKLSIEIIRKILPICPPALRVLSLIKSVDEFADIEIEVPLQIPDILDESSPISQLMQLHTMLWPGSFDFTSPL